MCLTGISGIKETVSLFSRPIRYPGLRRLLGLAMEIVRDVTRFLQHLGDSRLARAV